MFAKNLVCLVSFHQLRQRLAEIDDPPPKLDLNYITLFFGTVTKFRGNKMDVPTANAERSSSQINFLETL
jgi:hypothetical protein